MMFRRPFQRKGVDASGPLASVNSAIFSAICTLSVFFHLGRFAGPPQCYRGGDEGRVAIKFLQA